jgi:hypothetical protein
MPCDCRHINGQILTLPLTGWRLNDSEAFRPTSVFRCEPLFMGFAGPKGVAGHRQGKSFRGWIRLKTGSFLGETPVAIRSSPLQKYTVRPIVHLPV